MGSKLCPKIILEGTRLTHKTDIAFALNEHPRIVGPRKYRYHSPLISAEWCGFTNTPWGRGLINLEPAEAERAMETYRTWARLFQLLQYYSWIVDRFHISTMDYQRQHHGTTYDFAWLEDILAELGFAVVFCRRQPETFEAARAQRLEVSGNPAQYDDLQPFIDEQERLAELAVCSKLDTLMLDVSSGDIGALAETIADWLESTGGLWAP